MAERIPHKPFIYTGSPPTDPATEPSDQAPLTMNPNERIALTQLAELERQSLDTISDSRWGLNNRSYDPTIYGIQNGPYTFSMALESITYTALKYLVPQRPPTKKEMYMKRTIVSISMSTMVYLICNGSSMLPKFLSEITSALFAFLTFRYLYSAIPKPDSQ